MNLIVKKGSSVAVTRILSNLNGKYTLFASKTVFIDASTFLRVSSLALMANETLRFTMTSCTSTGICAGSNVTTVAIGTVTHERLAKTNTLTATNESMDSLLHAPTQNM
jgi:hypothetical protein